MKLSDTDTPYRYLDWDNGAWFILPDAGRVVTNLAVYAASVKYISPNGNDGNSGDYDYEPYKSFTNAIAKSEIDGLIIALPGTYEEGCTFGKGMSNRLFVTKQLLIRSKMGAENTTIKGYSTSDTSYSKSNIRPVAMTSGIHCAVQGFTLNGGNNNMEAAKGGNTTTYERAGCYVGAATSLPGAVQELQSLGLTVILK